MYPVIAPNDNYGQKQDVDTMRMEDWLPENKMFFTIADLTEAGYGSRTTIWREINEGYLPAVKLPSGRVLIPRDEFFAYIRSNTVNSQFADDAADVQSTDAADENGEGSEDE